MEKKRIKLIEARARHNWTLEQAAEQIGCAPNTLNRWELGKLKPSPYSRARLQAVYQLTSKEIDFIEHDKVASTQKIYALAEVDIMHSRRQLLQSMLATVCTALTLPHATLSESCERLEKILLHPGRLDTTALHDLSIITQGYWRLSANGSIDIINAISAHFTTITQLLRSSHTAPICSLLYSVVAECAQLLGKTLHDTRQYDLAWDYYSFSIKAAQEANNDDLKAVGLGRMALSLIHYDRPQKSLEFLNETKRGNIQDKTIRSWISAIQAEAYANLSNERGCKRAIDQSTTSVPYSEHYPTEFDASLQAGYEGACYARLGQPDEALIELQRAIDLLPGAVLRRRSFLYADKVSAYAQLGNIEQACKHAHEVLDLTMQMKSLHMFRRMQTIVTSLPSVQEVYALNDHIEETFNFFVKMSAASYS